MADAEKQSVVDAAQVRKFHAKDDVDAAVYSHHHTLGSKPNQASPGAHTHDGISSTKIVAVPAGGTAGQALTKNSATDYDVAWVTGGGGGGGVNDPGANGVMVRTALNTSINRNIAAGSTKISVSNPDGVAGDPTIDVVVANLTGIAESQVTGLVTDLAAKAIATRLINTTSPVQGGGDLSADRTISLIANGITNALAAQMGANTIKGNNTAGTANAADLTTAQVKTMLAITEADVANLVTDLAAKATDTLVCHLAGTETLTGAKTFNGGFTLSGIVAALAACTASIASLNMPSGTAKTTPAAGDMYATSAGAFFSAGVASNARRIPGTVFQRCTTNSAAATTGTFVVPTGFASQAVKSGRTYRFKYVIYYTVSATTVAFESRLAYPTLTAGSVQSVTFTNATAIARTGSVAVLPASPQTIIPPVAGVTTQLELTLEGFIIPSADGNLVYDFTPSTAGTATMLAGSFMTLDEVA